jgi:glycosyltransferase involved in cell wall biosynthesis
MEPLISVVIPNYNHGLLISDCIDALKKQTEKRFEVIIIDDASTDDSVEIISKCIQDDSRFKLFLHQKNFGVIFTLNAGISKSKAPFRYLGAADDITLPNLFANLYSVLYQEPDIAFAVCEVVLEEGDKESSFHVRPIVRPSNSIRTFSASKTKRLLWNMDNWTLTGGALLRRQKMESVGSLHESLGPNADGFLLRKLALTHGFAFLPTVGLIWRRSKNGYSAKSLLDQTLFNHNLEIFTSLIKSDAVFPYWYSRKYRNRIRFSQKVYQTQKNSGKWKFTNLEFVFIFLKYRPFSIYYFLKSECGRFIDSIKSKKRDSVV